MGGQRRYNCTRGQGQVNSGYLKPIRQCFRFAKRGIVLVKAKLKNNYEAAVTVRDTGMEIDPSPIPRLFTKFATKPEQREQRVNTKW
jgi:hypothetical protein